MLTRGAAVLQHVRFDSGIFAVTPSLLLLLSTKTSDSCPPPVHTAVLPRYCS